MGEGGSNLYAYCGGNPVMSADPSGNHPAVLAGIVIALEVVDFGLFAYGIYDFVSDPTLEKGLWSAVDLGFLILPGVPNIGGLRHIGKLAHFGAKIAPKAETLAEVYTHAAGIARSTYRGRHWRERSKSVEAALRFGSENIDRMKKGLAPRRLNPRAPKGIESMVLAHIGERYADGGRRYIELWPEEHASIDAQRYVRYLP